MAHLSNKFLLHYAVQIQDTHISVDILTVDNWIWMLQLDVTSNLDVTIGCYIFDITKNFESIYRRFYHFYFVLFICVTQFHYRG